MNRIILSSEGETVSNWITSFSTNPGCGLTDLSTDLLGNILISGVSENAGGIITRMDADGIIKDQILLNANSNTNYCNSVSSTSSDRIFLTMQTTGLHSLTNSFVPETASTNTSGNPFGGVVVQAISHHSKNPTHWAVVGSMSNNLGRKLYSYYQRSPTAYGFGARLADADSFCTAAAHDSSDNLYLYGSAINGTAVGLLIKLNPSFSIQWTRAIGTIASFDTCRGGKNMVCDSSGNTYISGVNSSNILFLMKFDTNGNLVWERLTNITNATNARTPKLHLTSEHIYIAYITASANFGFLKFDINGNFVFARSFSVTNHSNFTSIQTNGVFPTVHTSNIDGDIIFGFNVAGASPTPSAVKIVIAKIPSDGSKTGIYSQYNYTAISPTISNTTSLTINSSLVPTVTTSTSGLGGFGLSSNKLVDYRLL